MPVGMIVSYIRFACERRADVSCHIGVGFCVARRTVKGNARALNSKTSNRYRLLRFFVFMSVSGEFGGKLKFNDYESYNCDFGFRQSRKDKRDHYAGQAFPDARCGVLQL